MFMKNIKLKKRRFLKTVIFILENLLIIIAKLLEAQKLVIISTTKYILR